jgi:protein regulator of cytokinesis 1
MFGFLADVDSSSIQALWTTMGFDKSEQDSEQKKLTDAILGAIQDYQNGLNQTTQELKSQFNSVTSEYTTMMKAFGVPPETAAQTIESLDSLDLRTRVAKATSDFEAFKASHAAQLEQLATVQAEVSALFDKLEIPECDRGEFASIGYHDYTSGRIQRFVETATLLSEQVTARAAELQKRFASIEKISAELDVAVPEFVATAHESHDISSATAQQIVELEATLIGTKQQREAELEQKRAELNRLWNVLQTSETEREQFAAAWASLGASALEAHSSEITRLRTLRQNHLPQIIESRLAEIAKLEAQLHRESTPIDISSLDPNEACDALEQTVDTLTAELAKVSLIIESISQREELMREAAELSESARKVDEARAKKKDVDQNQLNRDEHARRRIKSLLPRLEKKLLIMLIEYQASHTDEPFLWDAKPYAANLDHIKLSDVEIRQARGGRRKSLQGSRKIKQVPSVESIPRKGRQHSPENSPAVTNRPK